VLAAVTGGWAMLPAAIGVSAVVLAAGCGANAVTSVLAPIPLPEGDSNPLAAAGGGGARAVGAMLAGTAVVAALTAPVVALAVLGSVAWPPASWIALAGGLCYALALVVTAARIAASLQDERGPDLLAAVTPST
jgi:ABC-2 type transport system permease protein